MPASWCLPVSVPHFSFCCQPWKGPAARRLARLREIAERLEGSIDRVEVRAESTLDAIRKSIVGGELIQDEISLHAHTYQELATELDLHIESIQKVLATVQSREERRLLLRAISATQELLRSVRATAFLLDVLVEDQPDPPTDQLWLHVHVRADAYEAEGATPR